MSRPRFGQASTETDPRPHFAKRSRRSAALASDVVETKRSSFAVLTERWASRPSASSGIMQMDVKRGPKPVALPLRRVGRWSQYGMDPRSLGLAGPDPVGQRVREGTGLELGVVVRIGLGHEAQCRPAAILVGLLARGRLADVQPHRLLAREDFGRVQPKEGRKRLVGQQQGFVTLLLCRDDLGFRDDGIEPRHIAFHREVLAAPLPQGFADVGAQRSVSQEVCDRGARRVGVEVGHRERSGTGVLRQVVGKTVGFAETNHRDTGQGRVHGDVRERIEPRRDHHDIGRRIGSLEIVHGVEKDDAVAQTRALHLIVEPIHEVFFGMRLRDVADPDEADLPGAEAADRGLCTGYEEVDALPHRYRSEPQNHRPSAGAPHGVGHRGAALRLEGAVRYGLARIGRHFGSALVKDALIAGRDPRPALQRRAVL